jgi:trehalose 6-phosphate phosphatase
VPPIPDAPLLLLDYDGTLAPIVSDPAAAFPHPDVPALLAGLAARTPVYLLTGRDLATLATLLTWLHVRPVPVHAVGLHGAEEGDVGGEVIRSAYAPHAVAFRALRRSVPRLEGIRIEEKGGIAFAVHFRGAPDEAACASALADWAATAPEALEPIWGKCVVEIRPRGVSKGEAAARIAAAHPHHTPVCLGDDVTDEHAFEALASFPDAVTVRVGGGESTARFHLPDVEAVVEYLHALRAASESRNDAVPAEPGGVSRPPMPVSSPVV